MNENRYAFFILSIWICFFIGTKTFAFSDVDTHPLITKKAAEQSILGYVGCTYLTDNLGFKNGLVENISGTTIETLIKNGAHTEDTGTDKGVAFCKRGLNHFYDPTKYGAGLAETVDFSLSW